MAGLVFLSSDHPLEQFVSNLVSVPYTQVGFICKDSISGVTFFNVYLVDLFGVYGKNIVTCIKMKDLINDPLLNGITIRWFNLPPDQEGEIRLAIASVLSSLKKPSLESMVKQLVGLDKTGYLGVDVVCQIFHLVGIELPHENLVDMPSSPGMTNDLLGAARFLGLIGKPFSRDDPRFRTLTRIGDLEEVRISPADPILKSSKLAKEIENSSKLFSDAALIFFKLFATNRSFMSSVLASTNKSSKEHALLNESFSLSYEMLKHIDDQELKAEYSARLKKLISMG